MSKSKTLHQNLKEKKNVRIQKVSFSEDENGEDSDSEKQTFQDNPNIFLLNNLLMSVQFFENFDRDIKLLRANWFKEVPLESHHKKCFYADSLFKLIGSKVNFSPCHGANKNLETSLHPLRIYISSDNIEAAYDPSALRHDKSNQCPQYQFTVRPNDDTDKSGCVNLVKFTQSETQIKSPVARKSKIHFNFNEVNGNETTEQNYTLRKSNFEDKCARRLTKTEKLIAFQNKEVSFKILEKRASLKFINTNKSVIPINGFYKFTSPEGIIKPTPIQDFRMNYSPVSTHEIPLPCFQKEEVKRKINSRRTGLSAILKIHQILHSTAYKGYFCDLFIEQISKPLGLDFNSVNQSFVVKEFIVVRQKGIQTFVTPVIAIRDWNTYVIINKKVRSTRKGIKVWPTEYMRKVINVFPCYAVPSGNPKVTKDNLDYEKTWKLAFPKAEEFLLLHMMHAHIRCYIFVLLIYKSFIETEINSTSFGPEHLMHLLFWRVHRNFFAWPEDRPGETLLNFLKILYKKLQNKTLYDFFMNSKNLFASSLPKDLHRVQTLIKQIIENPIPYIMRSIRNLKFKPDFYPTLDISNLHTVLTTNNEPKTQTKIKKQEKNNPISSQDDELKWKKKVIKQIELERKAEEEEQNRKLSVDSISLMVELNFNTRDSPKCYQVLDTFASHFVKLAKKSMEYKFFSQSLFYFHQTQKLLQLMIENGMNEENLQQRKEKIITLQETCLSKMKQNIQQPLLKEKKILQKPSVKSELNLWKKNDKHETITEEVHKPHEDNESKIISIKL